MDGIFLIDKPIGLTSRKVSNMVSFAYKEKKVGHVGTLDPFASGLLIVACGKCTKAVTFFDESVKEYIATIKLGKETDTCSLMAYGYDPYISVNSAWALSLRPFAASTAPVSSLPNASSKARWPLGLSNPRSSC